MSDPQIEGMKAEIARLRRENQVQRDEIKDLNSLIAAYRKWASECPILEPKVRRSFKRG